MKTKILLVFLTIYLITSEVGAQTADLGQTAKWNQVGITAAWQMPTELQTGIRNRWFFFDGLVGMSYRRQWVKELSWEVGFQYRQFYAFFEGLEAGYMATTRTRERKGSWWVPVRANYQSPGNSGFCVGVGFEVGGHIFDVLSRQTDLQHGPWQVVSRNALARELVASPALHLGGFKQWNDMVTLRFEVSLYIREMGSQALLGPRLGFTLFKNID
jgi:hypothetical protein